MHDDPHFYYYVLGRTQYERENGLPTYNDAFMGSYSDESNPAAGVNKWSKRVRFASWLLIVAGAIVFLKEMQS